MRVFVVKIWRCEKVRGDQVLEAAHHDVRALPRGVALVVRAEPERVHLLMIRTPDDVEDRDGVLEENGVSR